MPMKSPVIPPEETAAGWAARLDVAPLTRDEARALQAWLDESPEHGALLDQITLLHGAVQAELPAMAGEGLLAGAPASRPASRRWRLWTGGLAAAAALTLAAVWFARLPQEIATSAGQRQEVTLQDGSLVALNARTTLAFKVAGDRRSVRLEQGEAYFEVAKDPARPFLVETPAGTVRVTGTHFNVRADAADTLEVTVLEGSVAVLAGGTDRALAVGDQLEFNGATTEVRHLDATTAPEVIAWREGRIIAGGVPLRVVIARYARYHDVNIEVAPTVETLPIGGVFRLDDLDGFLRDAREMLPVHVLRDPSGRRIRVLPREAN
jgi:transmembrane sensor